MAREAEVAVVAPLVVALEVSALAGACGFCTSFAAHLGNVCVGKHGFLFQVLENRAGSIAIAASVLQGTGSSIVYQYEFLCMSFVCFPAGTVTANGASGGSKCWSL